jgi:hypothetical protein
MTSAQKSSIKRKQQGRRFVMTQELMGALSHSLQDKRDLPKDGDARK